MSSPAEQPPLTMLSPDFPFSYDHYLAHPAGLGSVPESAYGTEVAVIGAGLAGVITAYELMKMGLKPVVYEAGAIGGRLKSQAFDGNDDVVVDLGGMRFPVSGRAFYHYVDKLGLETRAFPNPLADVTPSTVVELKNQTIYAESAEDLPEFYQQVARAWKRALVEDAELEAVQTAIRTRDTATLKRLWNELVATHDDTSFYGFLASSQAFGELSFEHLETFGQVGFDPVAGIPISRTRSWRCCAWCSPMPMTSTVVSSVGHSAYHWNSGSTPPKTWCIGQSAPPWRLCMQAPREVR